MSGFYSRVVQLHNFHSSSASFRVRIALNLKGLPYEYVPVRLRWRDGDQHTSEFQKLNPQGRVPVLVDDAITISQTLAILEYLEEVAPTPPLLPGDRQDRARVRSISAFIACEIQPLQNIGVGRHLAETLDLDRDAQREWRRHWISRGFDVLEVELARARQTGRFCHGDEPTMADCFLVPQVFGAQRPANGLDLSAWPAIERIYRNSLEHPAIVSAMPGVQPDAPPPR